MIPMSPGASDPDVMAELERMLRSMARTVGMTLLIVAVVALSWAVALAIVWLTWVAWTL